MEVIIFQKIDILDSSYASFRLTLWRSTLCDRRTSIYEGAEDWSEHLWYEGPARRILDGIVNNKQH